MLTILINISLITQYLYWLFIRPKIKKMKFSFFHFSNYLRFTSVSNFKQRNLGNVLWQTKQARMPVCCSYKKNTSNDIKRAGTPISKAFYFTTWRLKDF